MINTNFQAMDSVFLNKDFPVKDCVIPNDKNEKIHNSSTQYICLIIDKRFPTERSIKIMSPYIYIENEEITYAWIDKNGNWVDNFENSVHRNCWDEFVIGWIPYEEDNDKKYLEDLVKKLQ